MNEIKLEMREIFLKRAKYVLNPYVTRINDDGRIINSDVMEVVNLCIENNILQGKKDDYVFTYHLASKTNPETYPEGWYKDNYYDCVEQLSSSPNDFGLLIEALLDRNVVYTPWLPTSELYKVRKEIKNYGRYIELIAGE